MTVRDHLGRSLAVSGALAVLGIGALTMTERALAEAPVPTLNAAGESPVFLSTAPQNNKPIGPLAGSVATSTITVPETAQSFLRDVDVRTFIKHSASGDIEIELTSPDRPGQAPRTVKLIVGPSTVRGTDDVFDGTLWDDSHPTLASDLDSLLLPPEVAPQANLAPQGSLGKFVGIDPRGTWILKVTDKVDEPDDGDPATPEIEVDGGTLTRWELHLATQNPAPAVSPAQTFASDGSSGTIATAPAPATTSTITVDGQKNYLWDLDLVTDIRGHSNPGELDIRLSHAGRTVVISTGSDGLTSFFTNRTFNDAATALVGTAADDSPDTVPFVPEGALAAFIGTDPNGPWTLSVSDSGGEATGTLNGFQLKIAATDGTAPPVTPPVTPPAPPAPPVVAPTPAPPVTPAAPLVKPQALKLGVRKFAVGKNRKKSIVRVNVGWFRGTGRVTYTATLSAKIGKKTVRRTIKGAGKAGVKNIRRTVKVPKNWKNKKVTVRLVVKNGSTRVVRTKTIRRF